MRSLSAASLVRARRLVSWGSFGSCTTWGSAVRTDEESPCNESRDLIITESLNSGSAQIVPELRVSLSDDGPL